jgi:hypothetical protein
MAAAEIILALFGLLCLLVVFVFILTAPEASVQPDDHDPAAPYRQGLHAAVRMQRVAQDLEQQIYAEAARHLAAEDRPGGEL